APAGVGAPRRPRPSVEWQPAPRGRPPAPVLGRQRPRLRLAVRDPLAGHRRTDPLAELDLDIPPVVVGDRAQDRPVARPVHRGDRLLDQDPARPLTLVARAQPVGDRHDPILAPRRRARRDSYKRVLPTWGRCGAGRPGTAGGPSTASP